ncbi:MAG TPA: undecaprenyl-diphosphate phosphatase [Streptosporangiaceae bacterium]|nr:undecaprenyl-diphosphate phosphatase [Streptosporangiaceae bacterium]
MTYLQAFVIALVQGVTELFPVSSLGHSVLIPAWIGGSWQTLVTQSSQQSSESSFYLAYIVALHCATALALMWFFRADWIRIIRGFFRSLPASVRASLSDRRVRLVVADKDERLAWLIVFATIPVGLTGLVLEHKFRVLFAKPIAAACLLFINGLILLAAEDMRRTAVRRAKAAAGQPAPALAHAGGPADLADQSLRPGRGEPAAHRGEPAAHRGVSGGRETTDVVAAERSDERLARLSYVEGIVIGASQVLALLAGISRSGITMAGGLWRGLDHEDAARFAFLLATPVILAAGVLKVPSLFGSAGAHIHGQVILGVIVCGIAAYLSVRFLVRWFETRTLTPFAVYCLVVGVASIARFI